MAAPEVGLVHAELSRMFLENKANTQALFRRTDPQAGKEALGRDLRFLANVDPIDVARALKGINPEETLVVVVSKTFTTAETMLNARTVRKWLQSHLGESVTATLFHVTARLHFLVLIILF
eukprot:351801-Chlamydomonas_euryale.AAC.26